jgi:hypothetical protein
MTEIAQKPHVRFDWKLVPEYRNAKYYDVYAYVYGMDFPVLIGATKGTDSDRIYPLNHPKFDELGTNHFAYETEISVKEYWQDFAFPFAIPDFAMAEILEFLKRHAPKEGDSHV